MEEEGECAGTSAETIQTRRKTYGKFMEMPVGLRNIRDSGGFSGFRDEYSNLRRIIRMERELVDVRELIEVLLSKQEQLSTENKELKEKCVWYEKKMNDINEKVEENTGKV